MKNKTSGKMHKISKSFMEQIDKKKRNGYGCGENTNYKKQEIMVKMTKNTFEKV